MRIVIGITVEDREDGGIRVYSEDLPGLILSGPNRAKVLADVEPAARELLKYNGLKDKFDLQVNATFTTPPPAGNQELMN